MASTCGKMVSGTIMSYPCELPERHEFNGPIDDPEPCRAKEVDRSIRMHGQWEDRQADRGRVEEFEAQTRRDAETVFVGDPEEEPEHNLRDEHCMMRPADSAPPIEGEECDICNPRPQVLVENDVALMAGEMHNPYDAQCSKADAEGPHRVTERCYVCRPDGTMGETDEAEFKPRLAENLRTPANWRDVYDLADGVLGAYVVCPHCHTESLKVDDSEATCGSCGLVVVNQSAKHFDLREIDPEGQIQFDVLRTEPTKQREGDQRLPAKGDQCVQDWVIETMEESKRVGSERYGQPLMTFDGRSTIQDLAEELRDAFVYISKLQMQAQADKATLVAMVGQALREQDEPVKSDDSYPLSDLGYDDIAEIAVDKILDWVLMQRLGEEG